MVRYIDITYLTKTSKSIPSPIGVGLIDSYFQTTYNFQTTSADHAEPNKLALLFLDSSCHL